MVEEKRWQAPYTSMRDYLGELEKAGLLKHITAEVDLKHEIGAIAARALEEEGPSLLFENIKGYPGHRLAANLVGLPRQLGVAFGCEPESAKIYERVVFGMQNRISSVEKATGPTKEVILTGEQVDLYDLAVPWWHELDGVQYLATTAGCITKDPETGVHNVGMYRSMIKSKDTFSLSGAAGGAMHMRKYWEKGQAAPFALAVGMDPLITLADGTAIPADEEGMAEYEAAGGWRGRPTELVRCETSDLLVPADAEYILEGEILPGDGDGERTTEGPHGESPGFYGKNDNCWLVRVKAITHRKDPINYGLICRVIEDYPRSLLRSGSFQTNLIAKTGLTQVKECYFPEVGRGGMMIVRADIQGPGDAEKIMHAVWEHSGYRWVIVVDEDCDIRNWFDVMWRVVSAADPDKGQVIPGKARGMGGGRTSREPEDEWDFVPPERGIGIDATMKFKDQQYFPPVNRVSPELRGKVAARWAELGFR